jgi:glycogen operon protein
MGVDGFRFDLAAVLGRGADGLFDRASAFFTALQQDPVLARVHLIAEPWDAGPQGYRVGDFPGRWMEWNDQFRDAARGFWLGSAGPASKVARAEFAARFGASADLYRRHQRRPTAGVNFISVHDGYTLADLVAYSHKHNHANGEDNRDGRDDELCAHFGVEGNTDDPIINATRLRVRRALMATLLLAQGTPMLCAGDEFGNSQRGNNNAWNQDNATGCLSWADADDDFIAFVAQLAALRRAEPLLRPGTWPAAALRWHDLDDETQALACEIGLPSGHPLLVAFNPQPGALPLRLPPGAWQTLLDSAPDAYAPGATGAQRHAVLAPHSLRVLRRTSP